MTQPDTEELTTLEEKTDQFIQDVYDVIAVLNHHDLLTALNSFRQTIKDRLVTLNEALWTYEDRHGERKDLEYDTREEVEKCAQEDYDRYWEEDAEGPFKNGEEREDEVTLIRFTRDDDGNETDVERIPFTVAWEFYHGDRIEHGTY